MASSPHTRVMGRELMGAIGQRRLDNPTRHRIDDPAGQRGNRVAGRPQPVTVEHRVVPADVHDNGAVLGVIGVDGMEHIGLRRLAPDDVVSSTGPGKHAHPGRMVGVPRERERRTAHCHFHVQADREVVDEHTRAGERHVMHHGHPLDGDVGHLRHPAVGADHHVLHTVHGLRIGVADSVEFAGRRVVLRMGGERRRKGSVESIESNGVQFVGERHRSGASLDHGPGSPCKAPHRGVGAEVPISERRA